MGRMRVGGDLIEVVLSVSMGVCRMRKCQLELKAAVYTKAGEPLSRYKFISALNT